MQGARVQSLVGELRSPMLHGAAKKKKKITIKLVCFKYRPIFSYFRDNGQKLAQFHTFGAKYLQIIPERHIVPLWFMDQL